MSDSAASLPAKPPFASPCNHCGECCSQQLCEVGKMAYPDAQAPCPALKVSNQGALCNIVKVEIEQQMEPMIQRLLGIGAGCSMADKHTTDAEIDRFDQWSMIKVFGLKAA